MKLINTVALLIYLIDFNFWIKNHIIWKAPTNLLAVIKLNNP